MTGWVAKRFWTTATVQPAQGGFGVSLDARDLRTPAKAPLIVPTRAMADAVAAEWQAQVDRIDPASMPVTRSANAAIDKVATQFDEVAQLIAAYGESDLLCYRAMAPEALVARQSLAWDRLLDWADGALGARLVVTQGVVPAEQPKAATAALAGVVQAMDAFRLTALHDLVGISGSLVIGLAATANAFAIHDLWSWSRIDEDWQAETWGADDDAAAVAASRRADFLHAYRFWMLSDAL